MKKRLKVISTFLILTFILVGCGKNENTTNSMINNDDSKKLKVYATVYPLYDFAKNIGKDKIDVELIIPNGQEPHDFEPDNKDIKNLESADVFIYNGAGLESWSEKVINSLDNKNLLTVMASDGVKLLETKDEENSLNEDPHVWLDPKNALIEAENIKNTLVKADEENKDYYEENFKVYSEKLKALDNDYKNTLENTKNKTIVVSHEAFGYLCNAYGLKQIGIEGVNAQSEPDAKTMAKIVEIVKEKNISTIFTEDIIDSKVAATIANEAKIKTEFLNPLESLTEDEISNEDDYISIMNSNLMKLEEALK